MDAGHGQSEFTEGRRTTILVVEDHPDTLAVVARLLTAQGYRVLTALDRGAAIELATLDAPDVLVADAQLPDGSGWDLLPLLRGRYPRLAGIAVTAHGYPEHVQRSRAAGFCDHLTKPISAQDLFDAVARCVASLRAA